MFHFLLELLFPERPLTGERKDERGKLKVERVIENFDQLRAREIHHLDRIVAACQYDRSGLIHRVIHTFKYCRIPRLHHELGKMIADVIGDADRSIILCPVPLHWSRKFHRGFNQAELLARVVGDQTKLPVKNLLKRKRATGHQAWRNREERLSAMKDAFIFCGEIVPDHVVLIDDLATTGATLDDCARALKRVGVKKVEGWVVAHG